MLIALLAWPQFWYATAAVFYRWFVHPCLMIGNELDEQRGNIPSAD